MYVVNFFWLHVLHTFIQFLEKNKMFFFKQGKMKYTINEKRSVEYKVYNVETHKSKQYKCTVKDTNILTDSTNKQKKHY